MCFGHRSGYLQVFLSLYGANRARDKEISKACLQILFADKRLVCQCGYVEIMSQATIVAAVDSICKERQKNFFIHSELREANKALRFFSIGIVT